VRFLAFDRITAAEKGKRMSAIKQVNLMDEYFSDHYPIKAVMPATFIIEALAQVGGMLNSLNHDFAVELVLVLVDGVHIHRQVYPGETLLLEVTMLYDHPYGASLKGEARVCDEMVANIESFSFAHEVTTDTARIKQNYERFVYQGGGYIPPAEVKG
jgi:3-hydroxyacyl-[acyl-carrier-protein] dehydratase